MCSAAKKSSQPHRLVPLANGMSQLAMTLSLLMIAVILPMLAKLRYCFLILRGKIQSCCRILLRFCSSANFFAKLDDEVGSELLKV